LIKAKRDKEKALKLVVAIIGKDCVLNHLQKNAGSADILDTLVAAFGNKGLSIGSKKDGTPVTTKKK
jgi:Trk-type K+ transport system membrane component